MEPTWHTFPDYLIETFPELKADIEESYFGWIAAISDPYPHFFLDEYLTPVLIGSGPLTDADARTKAGAMLDQLLTSDDEDLAAAALTSILEVFRDEEELCAQAWPYLGSTAREWLVRLKA